jgi:glucose/mannose-6-phosphate isomerase
MERLLENQEKLKQIDKADMLSFCVNIQQHYTEAAKIAHEMKINYPTPNNVIIAGMGGSAIGGDLLKDWAKNKTAVPIEVNRDYHLPVYANEKTLVLVTSYSGDTEESLSCFLDALKQKCMIFCVSSGGALLENAQRLNVPFVRVPSGMPPRAALPYMFVPLLLCLEKLGLFSGASEELKEALSVLGKVAKENLPEVASKDSLAKTLAYAIEGLVPVVYGFGVYSSVARRFKQQFNENSKMASKWEAFPELDHNEIVGWEKAEGIADAHAVILLRDKVEPVEISSRIETTKQLIKPSGTSMYEIYTQGKSDLAKMLSLICFGDFMSVYLAILRGVDPTPVETINKLKNVLQKNGIKDKTLKELGENKTLIRQ